MKKTILILSIITLFFAGCKKDDIFEEGTMGAIDGHIYVDLGLPSGLKWATCNVGADSPEEYGDYFAWGETSTKKGYYSDNCPTYGLSISELQSQGYIDSEGNLTSSHDAATANWGGSWRMPTKEEAMELRNNCTWTWISQDGIELYKITGPNGASIFIPCAGQFSSSKLYADGTPFYWTSTPSDNFDAYILGSSTGADRNRFKGFTIRPVLNENFEPEQPEEPEEPEQPEEPEEPEQPEEPEEPEQPEEPEEPEQPEEPEEPEQPEEPEEPETPAANQTITVNGVSFTMIAVEGGTFQMGATSEQGGNANSDESPVHSVTLSDYYIGETEVTQELWEAVMGSNPSNYDGYPQRPVEYVSWNDCQEFIKKLNNLTGKNFRLPTEAEWEYAARGGNKSKGYKYSGSNNMDNVAWYRYNSSSMTHDVKTKQANELGIYDMSGNVWEWCQDWYGSYSGSSQTNPTGPTSGSSRVYRGGGWYDYEMGCRVSDRDCYYPDSRDSYRGLRLALSQY